MPRQLSISLCRTASQILAIRREILHKSDLYSAMKITIALLAIIVAFSFNACTTNPAATKTVIFTPCCATHQPDKVVLLEDSFAPGGTVVRLVH